MKLSFKCPKCGKELTMLLSEKNNWHETENHRKCLFFSFGLTPAAIDFGSLISTKLVSIIIDPDKCSQADLDVALKALDSSFMVEIDIAPFKWVYIWKRDGKYYGYVHGINTPDSLASSHFDDVEKFARRWFNRDWLCGTKPKK